jgi:hypothetical protein
MAPKIVFAPTGVDGFTTAKTVSFAFDAERLHNKFCDPENESAELLYVG